jgi:uncharacterized SAM-binding protein YcdF (DUF218 family)
MPAFVLILVAVIAVYLAWLAGSIRSYAGRDEAVKADAVVVLGIAGRGSEPSPIYQERLNHGIDLYKQGFAPLMIFTGGSRFPGYPNEADLGVKYALAHGVLQGDILFERKARITEQNCRFIKELMDQEGIKRVIIVSDPLHMRRAMLMAHDLHMDAHPSPTPTTRINTTCAKLRFLAGEMLFLTFYLLKRPFTRR